MKKANVLHIFLLLSSVIGISLLHYFTPLTLPMLHDIFQRLYYIPIILVAFWFGFHGGVACAILVSIAYAPHGGHLPGHPLLESELFGHVKRAFTGAVKDKEGKFTLLNNWNGKWS